jgi:uncharacterized protein YkwD
VTTQGTNCPALTESRQCNTSPCVVGGLVDLPGLLPDDFVAAHNRRRCKHSVPLITWDPTVEASARAWASKCVFQHSSGSGYGENIAYMSGTKPTAEDFMKMWYDSEIVNYNYDAPGFTSGTGHFTQVVWKDTVGVGCGTCQTGTKYITVCQYSPAGNYYGQFPTNVPPLDPAAAECTGDR